MILFVGLFDLWVLSGGARSFVFLSALNLVLVALLSLFDGLFIDHFALLVWGPAPLCLPEGQPTRESMLRHLRAQFTAGWFFKVPIAHSARRLPELSAARQASLRTVPRGLASGVVPRRRVAM